MSTFHAVVWMDQSEAHVVMFDREHAEAHHHAQHGHHPARHQQHARALAPLRGSSISCEEARGAVAVKLLPARAGDGAARVRAEIASLRRLRLPGVIQLLDEGVEDVLDGGEVFLPLARRQAHARERRRARSADRSPPSPSSAKGTSGTRQKFTSQLDSVACAAMKPPSGSLCAATRPS